jgi:hypothetical protein
LGGVAADAFADADGAEAGGVVQGEAGGVLGEDTGLDGPDPGCLGGGDQRVKQGPADATALVQVGAVCSKLAFPPSIPAW